MGVFDLLKKAFKKNPFAGVVRKCPNCETKVTLDMERCPKCGVHIKAMFRKKCPNCTTANELDAIECTKCGYNFEEEYARAKKTVYRCPICGYKSEAFLTRCPACGTRFG